MKVEWLSARFELIQVGANADIDFKFADSKCCACLTVISRQSELERNPTMYYIIHGRPYVPVRNFLRNAMCIPCALIVQRIPVRLQPKVQKPQRPADRFPLGSSRGANADHESSGGQKRSAQDHAPRSGMDGQMQKRRKLFRKQVMLDRFKLSTQRGYEMVPAKNGKEASLLFTKLPTHLHRKRACLLRSRIGIHPTLLSACAFAPDLKP